ncbi:MAG: type II secretion system protein GspL [Magnetococcales bacterium]|nr:type II secretion system protein GspL [Magnetococcales bacterium]
MGERWLIGFPPDREGLVGWTRPGEGARTVRREPLARVAGAVGRRVVLVVPGEEVLLTRVMPPRASSRELEKALPYLLEESLSVSVETLHFAAGPRQADGCMPVAVVAERLMAEWMGQARAVGITPEAVIPEPLLLPLEPGAWSLLLLSERVLLRAGAYRGWAIDAGNLTFALRLALEAAVGEPPRRLIVWRGEGVVGEAELSGLDLPIEWRTLEGDPLTLLALGDRPGNGLDLAQGGFAPSGQLAGVVRALRPTLALALVWLALRIGESGWEVMRLDERAVALDQAIERVFRESFPEVKRIVNPRVQMNQQLEALRGQGGGTNAEGEKGFLSLFGRAGAALRDTPQLLVNGVRYAEGKLEMALRLPDLQRLDQVKKRMESQSLVVAILSANREGDGISARLRVESP